MPCRPIFAFCLLVLAGCTSSEPQKASYAPLGGASTLHSATPASATPASTQIANAPPNPASYNQTRQLPPSGLAEPTAAFQLGCHTVDNVTLCDVPADPGAEDTLYTN